MELKESFYVDGDLDQAWRLLTDVQVIADCFPGAELRAAEGNQYEGLVQVKFGPTTAKFQGTAQFEYGDDKSIVLTARGREPRSGSKASARFNIKAGAADGGATTTVDIDGDIDIVGPLAQFARAGGVVITRQLLADFAENLSAVIREQSPVGATAPAAPAAPPPGTVWAGQSTATTATTATAASGSGAATAGTTPTAAAPRTAGGGGSSINGFQLLWKVVRAWIRERIPGRQPGRN